MLYYFAFALNLQSRGVFSFGLSESELTDIQKIKYATRFNMYYLLWRRNLVSTDISWVCQLQLSMIVPLPYLSEDQMRLSTVGGQWGMKGLILPQQETRGWSVHGGGKHYLRPRSLIKQNTHWISSWKKNRFPFI